MDFWDSEQPWDLYDGDCIPHMIAGIPEQCVDFSVFSPPFPSLFAYSSEACDLGNVEDLRGETKIHFSFFFKGLYRVLKPGRVCVFHIMQIPGLARNGEKGTFDFRGLLIRLAKRAGFIYQYDWLVAKNPQAQAIRTHSHKLLFATLERDRAVSCGAMGDYLIKLIKPGDNSVPINSQEISRNEWIDWAEACWSDIRETDTLNVRAAKSESDTKHICPLQLEVIDRLIRLYSNPGEVVFSPFAGIGSEGYVALKRGRRFYGCEIKPEYVAECRKNLEWAECLREEENKTLFDQVEVA